MVSTDLQVSVCAYVVSIGIFHGVNSTMNAASRKQFRIDSGSWDRYVMYEDERCERWLLACKEEILTWLVLTGVVKHVEY